LSRRGRLRAPARPKNMKKTILRTLGYLKPFRLHLAGVVALVLLSSAAQVISNYLLRPLINDIILPLAAQSSPSLAPLFEMLAVMGAVYLVTVISNYGFNRLMVTVSSGALLLIRKDLFEHLMTLPISYFDRHTHGELMSRFTSDTDALRDMLSQSLVNLVSSSVTVVSVFIMMTFLSPILTLLVALTIPVMFLAVKFLGKRSGRNFALQQKALGQVNSNVEELVSGQRVVKVFNREEAAKRHFSQINGELFESARRAHTFAAMLMPITHNISHIIYALTAMAGALLTAAARFDIGGLASYLQYTKAFTHPITHMSQHFNSIMHALAGAERIFQVIDEQSEIDDGAVCLVNTQEDPGRELCECCERTGRWAWKKPDGQLVGVCADIRMENVVFSYEPGHPVLNGVSLFAKPGQKIALVGSTGAGKTTITNLINRFYEIDEGTITFDGIELRDFKKADLRRSLGMVLQDTHLFTGSVRENIRYGRLDASDGEVEDAARLANAHAFIMHLPNGYDTLLTSDGANLSQGQRQLISIARAAVADPPVLILDEATSSVDTRTEALIEKGMDRLMRGRTVFVIAHRLSTVRNAKAILVMEQGGIIERGSHDDLLAQKGRYHALYTGRFELK
jgi:ATP-binding cassette subfamily B multidrug efflux pump